MFPWYLLEHVILNINFTTFGRFIKIRDLTGLKTVGFKNKTDKTVYYSPLKEI